MLNQNVSNKYVLLFAFIAIILGIAFASFYAKDKNKTEDVQLRQIPNDFEQSETIKPVIIPENKQNNNPDSEKKVCIQVITPAKNLETGEVQDFPTPCDVPEGWKIIDSSN